jgi:hypothetical protein
MEEPAMTLTVFLARLLGFYCATIALAMLLRRRETVATVAAMVDHPGEIMLAGVIALAAGLGVVLGHEDWQGDWLAIAVSYLGWVMAAKGALLLLLPAKHLKTLFNALHYEKFFSLYMGGTLALGLVLLWGSFG